MGLSGSKTKTETKQQQTATVAPSQVYAPQIDDAAAVLKPSYEAATANNAALMPRVNSALDYYQNTMSQPLTSNPYLEGIIGKSNQGITDAVSSRFSSAGRYGSGAFSGVLARAIAENENQLRYQDYTTQQGRADQASRSLLGGVGVSAALPQAASSAYADAVRQLLGGYTTSSGTSTGTNTTTQSGNVLQGLLGLGGAALGGWASNGFKT